jgi:tRNA(fMet)-specific endonuclease VapC
MNRVVVDTDVASYLFNWHSSAKALSDALRGFDLMLSFMTVAEMRAGAIAAQWGIRRRSVLDRFIRGFRVAYANDTMCSEWDRIRAASRALGRPVSPQDAWVAAAAVDLNAPLATNNQKDFQGIDRLKLFFGQ